MLIKTGVSGLVNTIVLNTKISEVENKTSSISDLVKKTNCNAKISDTEAKHCTVNTCNKNKIKYIY